MITAASIPPVDASHNPSVLDAAALGALTQLDPTGANQLVRRVLTTYHASLERLLGQLAEARACDDAAAIRMMAHTLKSASASIGALALSALCAAAEQAALEAHDDALAPLLDRLQVEAGRVDAAVRDLLASSPA